MENEEIKFSIKRIYTRDVSFESPEAPKIFDDQTLMPKIGFNLNSRIDKLSDNQYEITLEISVKAETEDKVVYLVEIKQSGLFEITGVNDEVKQSFLNIRCPEILFPYARENISGLIQKGGFPPIFLTPIDFAALHHQEMAKNK